MQTDAPTDAVVVITCGVTDPALLIASIKTPPTSPNLENKSNLQDKILAGTPATIYDNKRVTINPNHTPLYANLSVKEGYRGDGTTSSGGNTLYVDFLSNGFKLRNSGTEGNPNVADDDVLYMAFAETPSAFTNSR